MNELSAEISKVRSEIPDDIKSAVINAASVVVDNSPKFSGQLRASIRVGLNAPDLSVVLAPRYERGAISNPEGISKAKVAKAIAGYKPGDTLYISSNLPYAWIQERKYNHLMFAQGAASIPVFLNASH